MGNLIVFLYVAVNIFLLVLNFSLFTATLNIDLGFGIFTLMPLLFLQVMGLLFLLLFNLVYKSLDNKKNYEILLLEKTVSNLEKDVELVSLKSKIELMNSTEEESSSEESKEFNEQNIKE